jgi:hypothetical protein
LKLFAQWAGDREPDTITAREIELDYLGQWHDEWERRNGRPPSDNTKRNHIQALRALYKFLERFDLLKAPNPMTRIEAPKIKRRGVKPWLRPDEDDALLAAHVNAREQGRHLVPAFHRCSVGRGRSDARRTSKRYRSATMSEMPMFRTQNRQGRTSSHSQRSPGARKPANSSGFSDGSDGTRTRDLRQAGTGLNRHGRCHRELPAGAGIRASSNRL